MGEEEARDLPLGGKGGYVAKLQKQLLLGRQQRGDLLGCPAVDPPLAVDQDRVVARRLEPRCDVDLPPLDRRDVPVVREYEGCDVGLGFLHGPDRRWVLGDLVKGICGAGCGVDDNGAVHPVVELAELVGVVPVRAGLRGLPPVNEACTGPDLPLGEAGHAVRPGSVEHLDAVIVHRGVEGHLVVHRDLDVVPVVDLEQWPGELAIGQDHVHLKAVGRVLLPRQGQCEGSRLAMRVGQ